MSIEESTEAEKTSPEEKWRKTKILSNAFDLCATIFLLLIFILFSIVYWWITIITLFIVGILIYIILKRNKKKTASLSSNISKV